MRHAIRVAGLKGYRAHPSGIPGRPDFVFQEHKLAVFVHGCFWHRCPRCNLPLPRINRDFWARKFDRNVVRDYRKKALLGRLGWTVLVLWECEVKRSPSNAAARIKRSLEQPKKSPPLPR